MTNLINFNYNNKEVRTQIINNEPYFCLKDVCEVLEIKDFRIERLDEAGVILNPVSYTSGTKKLNFINEPNLYRVIFRSDKPEAKSFQNWVFEEVLPTLRKTGKYEIADSGKNCHSQVMAKNATTQKQLNQINLNDHTNYQFYHLNDILLSFPYFRYKIDKDTNLPLINTEDFSRCMGFESYSLHLLKKDNPNKQEVEFNKLYDIIPTRLQLFKDYLEQFRQAYKKAMELKLLQELNNCEVIEEDYEERPAIADYINLIGTEKLLTATEIGEQLGISNCMVGKIANKLNLKCEEYGQWFKEQCKNSIKEVQTFRYNHKVVDKIREYLGITEAKLLSNC